VKVKTELAGLLFDFRSNTILLDLINLILSNA